MKKAVVDTSVIISLSLTGHLPLIEKFIGDWFFPEAVWYELLHYKSPQFDPAWLKQIEERKVTISGINEFLNVMDRGESEALVLYLETGADFLLIDDQKARKYAESLGVNCIGSLALVIKAYQSGKSVSLRETFNKWLISGRFFSKKLLNELLAEMGEEPL